MFDLCARRKWHDSAKKGSLCQGLNPFVAIILESGVRRVMCDPDVPATVDGGYVVAYGGYVANWAA